MRINDEVLRGQAKQPSTKNRVCCVVKPLDCAAVGGFFFAALTKLKDIRGGVIGRAVSTGASYSPGLT
jgi:hypothetical protein